jgi:hypothetical protein
LFRLYKGFNDGFQRLYYRLGKDSEEILALESKAEEYRQGLKQWKLSDYFVKNTDFSTCTCLTRMAGSLILMFVCGALCAPNIIINYPFFGFFLVRIVEKISRT